MRSKNVNSISWGLFNYKPARFWKNIIDIKYLFKRIWFVMKHGYVPQAKWETFAWFIDVMKEILCSYRYDRFGTGVVIDDYWNEDGSSNDEKNEAAYNAIIDEMIELLDKMDESNPIYFEGEIDFKANYEKQCAAKDRFFELFSRYFYTFWD